MAIITKLKDNINEVITNSTIHNDGIHYLTTLKLLLVTEENEERLVNLLEGACASDDVGTFVLGSNGAIGYLQIVNKPIDQISDEDQAAVVERAVEMFNRYIDDILDEAECGEGN